MLRICIIGPGDIPYHYETLLHLPSAAVEKHLDAVARVLVDQKLELVLLPDKGVSFELAKTYKRFGGGRVFATVPQNDTDFGVKHLTPYLNEQIDGKKVIDVVIDTNDWYRQHMLFTLFGDVVLLLGNSLGSMYELMSGFYIYKLLNNMKEQVQVNRVGFHSEVIAGRSVPFSVIIYEPFMKSRLAPELDAYIRKVNGMAYYVSNAQQLAGVLKELMLMTPKIG